jgi:prophage regulatory protein
MTYDQIQVEDRMVRLPEITKYLSISPSTWWKGVKSGRFPAPTKLGARISVWRWSDIVKLVAPQQNELPMSLTLIK